MVFDFAKDTAVGSDHRSSQVLQIIALMIMLAHRRGRPNKKENKNEEAA